MKAEHFLNPASASFRSTDAILPSSRPLAKIYEEQEYYDQALDVYSKLILLYPKKSAYFADCVEKLQLKRNISNAQIKK